MSRPDAERALSIYKTFGKQTDQVVQYLSLARQYEMSTRLEVPKLKHAPTTLTASLEEYLNDPDFEVNRRQYLAQQEAKRNGKHASPAKPSSTAVDKYAHKDISTVSTTSKPPQPQPRGPAPDLIDFFESIEQNQQVMAQPAPSVPPPFNPGMPQAQPYQPMQIPPQHSTGFNPFFQQAPQPFPAQNPAPVPQQLQTDFTAVGFGGYTSQPHPQPQLLSYAVSSPLSTIPQNGVVDFNLSQGAVHPPQNQSQPSPLHPQYTSTNPFRHSMMPTGASQFSPASPNPSRQSTNPFAKSHTGGTADHQPPMQQQNHLPANTPPFFSSPSPPQQGQGQAFSAATPLQPQRTGTNPFAKHRLAATSSPVVANVTGSTNPFRQSAFVNQQTGQGWQHDNQGTFSGFDINNVETVPVFPRPGHN